jgi:hypothetical protein
LFPSGLEVPFVVQCNPQAPRPGAGQVSSPSYSPARDAVAAVPAAPRSPVGPVPWHRPRLLASSRSLATGGRGQGRKCGDAGSRDSSAVRGVATGGVASRAESGRGAWPQGARPAGQLVGDGGKWTTAAMAPLAPAFPSLYRHGALVSSSDSCVTNHTPTRRERTRSHLPGHSLVTLTCEPQSEAKHVPSQVMQVLRISGQTLE